MLGLVGLLGLLPLGVADGVDGKRGSSSVGERRHVGRVEEEEVVVGVFLWRMLVLAASLLTAEGEGGVVMEK